MTFNPGKSVGRVSIRAVPDTTRFRSELKKKLDLIEKTTHMTVQVDKAKVDKARVRESIERQLATMRDVAANSNVQVTVDSARIRKQKLRQSIQEQIDRLSDVRVNIAPVVSQKQEEKFHRQIDRIIRKASGKNVKLDVVARSAEATTKMRILSRDRIVELFVKVNKAALAKAAATLGALSGARLGGSYLNDILDFARNLDKNLPSLLGWSSALTALGATLASTASGLVGLGAGFASMLPGLLVVPGLLVNAMASFVVLRSVWKHAKTEVPEITTLVKELGATMRQAFWDRARQPIRELLTTMMPQLKASFKDLSAGLGDFTVAMARAFQGKLANGRLQSIFKGIGDGWRVLGKGADGFAGALVSLTEIAARYTPRLASWLVRQAATFDRWLVKITTNKSLTRWMDGAVNSMYDLWDAARGTLGVFQGLWKAADQAGSGGLHGFAQMMLDWKKTVNTAEFQTGLQAIFRGSAVAVGAFSTAIKDVGHLIADMPRQFENLVGSLGGAIGRIISGFAVSLDSMSVRGGLDQLSAGLTSGIDKILPKLTPISNTIGSLLGLIGSLADKVLPTAISMVAGLMPAVDSIITNVVEPILGPLTGSLGSVIDTLSPAITSLVTALAPATVTAFTTLATALSDFAPLISDAAGVLTAVVQGLNDWSARNKGFFNDWALNITPDEDKWRVKITQAINDQLRSSNGFVLPKFDPKSQASVKAYADSIVRVYSQQLKTGGPLAAQAFYDALQGYGVPDDILKQVTASINHQAVVGIGGAGATAGDAFAKSISAKFAAPALGNQITQSALDNSQRFLDGLNANIGKVPAVGSLFGQAFVQGIDSQRGYVITGAGRLGYSVPVGLATAKGAVSSTGAILGANFAAGVRSKGDAAASAGRGISSAVRSGTTGVDLYGSGRAIISQFVAGIGSKFGDAAAAAARVVQGVRDMFPNSPAKKGPFSGAGWGKLGASGAAIVDKFAAGLKGNSSKISSAASSLISRIQTAINRKDIGAKAGKRLIDQINATTKRLAQSADARAKVADKLTAAQKKVDDLVKQRNDYVASVRDSVLQQGDVSSFTTVPDMVKHLQAQVVNTRKFKATLDALMKKGLDSTTRDQLLQAFLQDGSTGAADAIAKGGAYAIDQIGALQRQLSTAGTGLGSVVGDQMYGAGIRVAEGLVKGLESQQKALEAAADRMANALVKQVRKTLQIHSPSRVTTRDGEFTAMGYVNGVRKWIPKGRQAMAELVQPVRVGPPSSTAPAGVAAPSGDTYNLYGITTREAAEQIAERIETPKRRRMAMSGALIAGRVS